jgi:hypothetical protein
MSNILIITSSGGGGLLQSAIAIEQEERKIDPKVNIIKKDLLMEWTGGLIGLFGRFFYNWTQRSGNVLLTNIFVNCNRYADSLFYPLVFSCTLYNLFKHNVDRVIDNQPMNANAITRAIRFYNWWKKKNIFLEKVFVDLPTKEYKQMMKGVKCISKKDKKFIKIFTVEPLLDGEKNDEEFWKKNCALPQGQVIYKKYIIRESFKKFQGLESPKGPFEIKIRFHSNEEGEIIKKCFSKGSIKVKEGSGEYIFTIFPEDSLYTVLLGSQPSSNAVYKYVKGFIQKIKTTDQKGKKTFLFIFADKFSGEKETLFHKILKLIEEKNHPQNLFIIPMSFQKDDVIAPLFYRSNLTLTRSGGHTMMELMAVSKGKKLIHSEAKKKGEEKKISYAELLKGIPCWELGNARYLHEKFNGDIVTPDTILEDLEGYL